MYTEEREQYTEIYAYIYMCVCVLDARNSQTENKKDRERSG